jgi:diguanylate cyclase (GGDEF)-like protein/PAS domain S-box-containing protein
LTSFARRFLPGRRAGAPADRSLLEWAARASPIGLLAVAHDGRIAAANTACCALLHCSKPPTGVPLAALVHPDDREWFAPALQRLTRSGGEVCHEVRAATHSDASPRWIQLRLRADVPSSGRRPLVAVSLEDVSARRFRDEMLHRLADADPLTGLFNCRRLDDELGLHLERGRRYGPQGALLLIDIDDLKGINDRGGHAAGDLAIRATAALLRARVRGSDVIARVGGDEFAVLLFDGAGPEAQAVARDLLAVRTVEVHGREVPRPSLSLGIAAVDGTACEPDALRSRADAAMYRAKRAGGERVAIAGAALSARVLDPGTDPPRTPR